MVNFDIYCRVETVIDEIYTGKANLYNRRGLIVEMIIWINGAFGSGKTTVAYELHKRLQNSFVYDPENIGYFLRKNTPPECFKDDFQDITLWRKFNYQTLKMIYEKYSGTVIVPMTIVNKNYYNEIVQQLIEDNIQLEHFILYANKETILKRLKTRSFRFISRESFAVKSIDRCLDSFDNHITDIKIITDKMTIDQIVDSIASKSNLTLLPDNRSNFKKAIDKLKVLIEHIRS